MVGTQVWLEGTHLCLPYQATKLAPKRYGPFKVTKEISPVAYQLHLPNGWNIHDIFHASLLSPYCKMAAHGPNYSRPPPELIKGEEEYEVEKIINHRCSGQSRTLQYLIKWKGYPEADNTWELADQVHALELLKTYHRQHPLHDKREKKCPRKSIHFLSTYQTCQTAASLSTTVTNRGYHSSHRSQPGRSAYRQYARNTLLSPTKKSNNWLDWTAPSSAYWPKYEGDRCPLGLPETSYRATRLSTQPCSEALSTPWLKAFDGVTCATPGRRSYWRRLLTTSKGRVSPVTTSIRNAHSRKHPQGIKKTGERSTLISRAKTEQGESPSGSSDWTEEKSRGIQTTMPQGISPSSWTSMPPENTTMTTTINPREHFPSGSFRHWWGAAPPLPLSVTPSTNSPPTTGDSWPRSICTGRWTSSAKASRPNSTSSSRRWRRCAWNEVSAKGDLKRPKLISTSAASTWVKQGHDMNKTKCEETCSARCGGDTVVDVGVHSSEERGVTGLGCLTPL